MSESVTFSSPVLTVPLLALSAPLLVLGSNFFRNQMNFYFRSLMQSAATGSVVESHRHSNTRWVLLISTRVFVEVLSADGTPTPGHHVNVTLRALSALSALRPANATKPTGPDGHACDRQANQTCGQYTSKKACTSSCGMGAGGAGR